MHWPVRLRGLCLNAFAFEPVFVEMDKREWDEIG